MWLVSIVKTGRRDAKAIGDAKIFSEGTLVHQKTRKPRKQVLEALEDLTTVSNASIRRRQQLLDRQQWGEDLSEVSSQMTS